MLKARRYELALQKREAERLEAEASKTIGWGHHCSRSWGHHCSRIRW
jgi:hypothetical protein